MFLNPRGSKGSKLPKTAKNETFWPITFVPYITFSWNSAKTWTKLIYTKFYCPWTWGNSGLWTLGGLKGGPRPAGLFMLSWFIFTRYMRYIYALCDKMVTRPLFIFLVLEFLFLVSLLMNWFVWFFWTGYFHLPVWSPFWDSVWYVFFHYNKLHKRCEPENVDYQGCVWWVGAWWWFIWVGIEFRGDLVTKDLGGISFLAGAPIHFGTMINYWS